MELFALLILGFVFLVVLSTGQGGIVASNALLLNRATSLQTLLNTGHTLRLFSNNLSPAPVNVLSDFTEATFTGYASVSLSGAFGSPTLIMNGEYQIASGTYTFSCTGGSPQTIYGFYLDDGTNVKFSQAFSAPIAMMSGSSFTLQIQPQDWALAIVP